MGDVLPFERSEYGDRRSDVAPDAVSSAVAPEGEVVDFSAELERRLRSLSDQNRQYMEHAKQVDDTYCGLRARLFGGAAMDDDERAALLDQFEGARTALEEVSVGAREMSAQLAEKLAHFDRVQAHRRASNASEAA